MRSVHTPRTHSIEKERERERATLPKANAKWNKTGPATVFASHMQSELKGCVAGFPLIAARVNSPALAQSHHGDTNGPLPRFGQ